MRESKYFTGPQLDRLALSHRRQLGFRDDQSIDFMTLITKIKHRYPEFDYRRIPDDQWHETSEAFWNSDNKSIEMPERTFYAANTGIPRSLMTITHEIAHALLGHKGKLHRAPTGNASERWSSHIRMLEWQARRYAAGFLMPDTPWLRSATVYEIEQRFNVSKQAAEIRIREVLRGY
jgi:hypothetical protein